MLYPFDYFIIIIFLFFLLSQFYIFYIVQFLFIRSDVKQILKSTKLFFLCSEKNSLFLFPSIFVDIFLFPFIFISCWCNLFYLLKYLKYNQINRKIHGETSISTRPWRSNIDRVFLSNSCFRTGGFRFEILFKFSIVSRANKFSDKDELFYVFITAIAEIQAWSSILSLPSPSLFHILHYFVPFVSGFIISVLYTGWINASKRVIVIANNLRCAQSSVTIKLLTLH